MDELEKEKGEKKKRKKKEKFIQARKVIRFIRKILFFLFLE